MKNQSILIFGSNSVLSVALFNLLNQQYDITFVYSGNNYKKLADNTNYITLQQALITNKQYQYVIIISAIISITNADTQTLFRVNVDLIKQIALKFNQSKIILCSSISVYQPNNQITINENTLLFPQNEYAISKLWAEKIIETYAKSYVIFRISSIISKNIKPTTFIPIIINQAKQHNLITLFGNGSRKQNYIHVNDLAKLIAQSFKLSINCICLGVSDKSYSNYEIATEIKNQMPNIDIEFKGEDASNAYCFDASKTYDLLGYKPGVTIKQMISELIHG